MTGAHRVPFRCFMRFLKLLLSTLPIELDACVVLTVAGRQARRSRSRRQASHRMIVA